MRPPSRSPRAAALALALVGSLAGCGPGDAPEAAGPPAADRSQPGESPSESRRATSEPASRSGLVVEPVVLRLAPRLEFADQRPPAPHLRFDSARDRDYLSSGWHPFEQDEAGRASAWTRGRDAVVEVPLVSVGPLVLALTLEAREPVGKLPNQRLALAWNGEPLGAHTLAPGVQELEVEVPPSLQRLGPNRLDLMPLYWLDPDREGPDVGKPNRGVRVLEIRFAGAARRQPGDDPAAERDGDDILLRAESIVTFALPLPEAARLRGQLALDPGRASGGRVELALLTEDGSRRLFESPLAGLAGGPVALDLALGSAPGTMAALTLSHTAGPGAELVAVPRLRLRDLRIEGTRQRVAAPEDIQRAHHNVLFVLFDTLRSDFTEPYGSRWVETPHLQALADSGVVFEQAFANASWTRPSVASLLTSLQPNAHRVLGVKSRVPERLPYLPAILRQAGYATLAVSNNAHVNDAFGFSRGFDSLHEHFREKKEVLRSKYPEPERQAEHVWERYVAPALARAGDRPFFVYLHEIDPHFPYEPLPPFDELYGSGYQGNVMGYEAGFKGNLAVLRAANHYAPWLGEADVQHLRDRYAGEITYMDRYLGWLLGRLERDGLREQTLVVFLSDHGEQFMEHGRWGHGRDVYQEVLSVPLVFSLPGVLPKGARPRVHAQLTDVAPTVLDLLGIEGRRLLQGESLLPFIFSSELHQPARAIRAKSEVTFLTGPQYKASESFESLRYGDFKLVRRLHKYKGQASFDYALYDLASDPGEKIDRWPTRPVVGEVLRQMFDRERLVDEAAGRQGAASEVPLDPGVRANLEALGYIE